MLRKILCDPTALIAYCRTRFELTLSTDDAIAIAAEAAAMRDDDRQIGGCGWFNNPAAISFAKGCEEAAVIWLKNRLRERAYFDVPHADPPEIRLTVPLHFWPWEGASTPCREARDLGGEAYADIPRSRSSIYDIAHHPAVDHTARVVAGKSAVACDYCREWFPTDADRDLHLLEHHFEAITGIAFSE